jgi:signal transduction histidine kinase
VRQLRGFCLRWADPLLALVLTTGAAGALAAEGQLGDLPGSLCVLAFCALVAGRRWHPLVVAMLAGLLIAIPQFAGDAATVNANGTFVSGWAAVFLYSYALGADAPFPLSLVGIVTLLVGVNLSDGGWNPVPEMLALGPYAAGLAVASRRRASAELEVRAAELEEEREIFAEQSVRYERARIARELHDIVAHSVSLMVVQANAGERLAAVDPASAAEAFTSISDAARQAEVEIDRLVELLNDAVPAPSSPGLRIVEDLVARAQASGLDISCQLGGDIDDLSGKGAEAAYRMVQEGITNAMKHAPGASIAVMVRGNEGGVEISVTNGPPRPGSSGLERSGGGQGLAGMRERITQSAGRVEAGPTPGGGWQLRAHLPHRFTPLPVVRANGASPDA